MAAESPVALIYGSDGSGYIETSIRAGIAVPSGQPGFLALGSDGTNTRYIKVSSTGVVIVDGSAVTQPVSGTFWQATQPVSIAATVAVSGPLTDAQLRASAVPISVASLPLPAGAATEATLATLLTTGAFQARIPVNGQALMAASVPVAIASNQSAIPVTDNGGSLTVDGTVAATQSGTWTVQQGTPPWTNRIQDGSGSNLLAVDGSGRAAIQNQPNMDVALSTRATETTLASIKDTDGIKKITDALPTGNNRLGKVKLVDSNDVALDLARGSAVPAGTRGLLVVGEDVDGVARAVDVRIDPNDSKRRLQIEGKVTLTAPVAPPSTTAVTIAADTPLAITTDTTTSYIITNGKTFYIQQIACGSEGDSTERGSVVEVKYYDGATEHLVERIYVNGFTQYGVLPDTSKARDGTLMTGNGTTKTIRITRRRLSGASQEVDAVVRGYEQ